MTFVFKLLHPQHYKDYLCQTLRNYGIEEQDNPEEIVKIVAKDNRLIYDFHEKISRVNTH